MSQPGTLLLIVGPSGVGKDTLIGAARASLGAEGFEFPRRWITTVANRNENHRALTEAEFEAAAARCAYALHWTAHGLRYGIGREIDDVLRGGRHVVVNVSRGVIDAARSHHARCRIVSVTAPGEVLSARLGQRGRESAAEIDRRLQRAGYAMPEGDDVFGFMNDRPLAESAVAFVALLRGLVR
jgi:phosphonate metabolism protein PhnN/1,5-bisphosphokinase (PRPP-forming)